MSSADYSTFCLHKWWAEILSDGAFWFSCPCNFLYVLSFFFWYFPLYFIKSDQKPNDNWCFLNVLFFHKRQPPKHKKCVVIFVKDKMQMMETTQLILLYFTSYITKITIVALILVHILLIIAKAAMRCAFVHSTLFAQF